MRLDAARCAGGVNSTARLVFALLAKAGIQRLKIFRPSGGVS